MEGLTYEIYIQINPARMRKTEKKQVWQNIFNFDFRWYTFKHSFYYFNFLLFDIFHNRKWQNGRINQKSQALCINIWPSDCNYKPVS